MARRGYPPEFRQRAVALVEGGRKVSEVAAELEVSEQTADGKTLRFLTVIDEFTREALWIECGRRLNSVDVVRVLEHLVSSGAGQSDNGPEFVAEKVRRWIEERGIGAIFIEPGSPWLDEHRTVSSRHERLNSPEPKRGTSA